MMEDVILGVLDFLCVAEFSQAVLLVFILFVMERNRRANIFFAAFILILSVNFFSFYLLHAEIKVLASVFFFIAIPGISLSGVFIYFYAMFITGLLERLRLKHLLHFVVYLVCVIAFITGLAMSGGKLHDSELFRQIAFITISIGLLSSISYIVYTLLILKKYYHKIENYYSDLEKMSLNWVQLLSSLSFVLLLLWCVGFWLAHLGLIPRNSVGMTSNIVMLNIIIFVTAYRLVNQPEIFRQNLEMTHEIEETGSTPGTEKYARQSIDGAMQDAYLAKLDSFMLEKKPYLDENITIKDLSDRINIPSHHLSIVINNRLGKNFYTFINEYRIKEALAILDDPDNSEASIIAVAFRSGFNSKSTFNAAFKKITGKTPSEYRKRLVPVSDLAS